MNMVTTYELSKILAGGDSFIRTKDSEVKGLAITLEKNPEAPEIIVVGKGSRKIANVYLLLESQKEVPVYLKQYTNAWSYLGKYRAVKYYRDTKTIEKYRVNREANEVDGILFLSSYDDTEVNVTKHFFPNIETKKKIELAAIRTVKQYYKKNGFNIYDRQADNCGYDLLIKKGNQIKKIEVKGTSSLEQRFYLSRKEKFASIDPLWRLIVVTEVLSIPKLKIYSASEMESSFKFDAICWECKKQRT